MISIASTSAPSSSAGEDVEVVAAVLVGRYVSLHMLTRWILWTPPLGNVNILIDTIPCVPVCVCVCQRIRKGADLVLCFLFFFHFFYGSIWENYDGSMEYNGWWDFAHKKSIYMMRRIGYLGQFPFAWNFPLRLPVQMAIWTCRVAAVEAALMGSVEHKLAQLSLPYAIVQLSSVVTRSNKK